MKTLNKIAFILSLLLGFMSFAEEDPPHKTCTSAKEYIETLNFLRKESKKFSETAARNIAMNVAKGCSGASKRFEKIYRLVKKIGLHPKQALQIAIEYSSTDEEVFKNFFELFQKAYLAEFFDFDFKSSFQIAYDLSKNYKGDPQIVRKDFLSLVKFCSQEKKLGLPLKTCALYASEIAKLSQYYPKGIFPSFKTLYEKLRKPSFNYSIKKSFEVIREVLKYGPTSSDNFLKSYNFALKEDGLNLNSKEALKFALKITKLSVNKLPPPLAQKKDSKE